MDCFLFLGVTILFLTTTNQGFTDAKDLHGGEPCYGPHEEYQCGAPCQAECATLGQKCPFHSHHCTHGCYCVPGYARNFNGICIPDRDCPGFHHHHGDHHNDHYDHYHHDQYDHHDGRDKEDSYHHRLH